MDSDDIKRAGDLLEHLLGQQQAGEARRYASFFSRWDELVGPELSGHSRPKDIEKGVLIVQTDHPGWLQIFQMSKERILRAIREQYPELGIKNLRIILGNPMEREGNAAEREGQKRPEPEEEAGTGGKEEPPQEEERQRSGEELISRDSRLHRELEKLRRSLEERSGGESEEGS